MSVDEVSPEIVKLVTKDFMQDPYPALDRLRREQAAAPIDSSGMRMWVVTRFADARKLLADPAISKDIVASQETILRKSVLRPEHIRGVPVALRRHMLDRDEPDHTRMRRLVSRHFTGTALESLRPRVAQWAAELADELPSGQPVDLVAAFARPLARVVTSHLLGLPSPDDSDFPAWVNSLLTAADKTELQHSATALLDYIHRVIDGKRQAPADDMLTDLVQARARGELNDPELTASVQLLLTGGMEPLNAIANTVHALLTNPDQLAKLRADPDLLPGCVAEGLRYESPFRMLTPRYSTAPIDLGDVVIPEHEMILVSAASANRDPDRFSDPDAFDISRNKSADLSFGRGIHRCLGAQLGLMETEIALSTLLARYPRMRLAENDAQPRWQPGLFMRRLHSLPVVLSAVPAS